METPESYNFTELVLEASKCDAYSQLDSKVLRVLSETAKYDMDISEIDDLEDEGIDTYEEHCINRPEVEEAEEQAKKEYLDHLYTCKKEGCVNLRVARIAVNAMPPTRSDES